jgi:steroid 5-alpha reductase family enzyme
MIVTWLFAVRIHNASIVDIVWSGIFAVLALFYAIMGDGYGPRKLLFFLMVSTWSIRLAYYLFKRIKGHHPAEDARYAQLRKEWEPAPNFRFLVFFELQGIFNILLSIPFLLVCMNSKVVLLPVEFLGAAVWLVGVIGESTSDGQLSRFKKDPVNRGKTMDQGLWRYSRHPNYFFEWVIWCGYFIFALGSPYGWVSVYCPILMYYVLTRITGVPMAEEQSIKSRGDEYRNYQKRTSVFFPWRPKKVS